MGGAIHPDELLNRMTARQWVEWGVYLQHFPTPMMRADINTALIRQSTLAPYCKNPPDAKKLMPRYGQQKHQKTGLELLAIAKQWARNVEMAERSETKRVAKQ